MRPALPLTCVLAAVALAADCSHAVRPCPPPRSPAMQSPVLPPPDPATLAAIAAAGARYEGCDSASAYVVAREGTREPTEQELRDLRVALFTNEWEIEAMRIGGVGCPPSKARLGVVLSTRDGTITPAAVAERLAALAAQTAGPGGDASARVQVTLRMAPGPRCAASDPACGPEPYEAACLERTNYDPKGKRTLVLQRGGHAGQCTYDGECVSGGCGNECQSAFQVNREGTCEHKGMKDAYCGCVKTACVWFTTN